MAKKKRAYDASAKVYGVEKKKGGKTGGKKGSKKSKRGTYGVIPYGIKP